MSLVRWDPFADMALLREQVNNLFEQSLTRSGREPFSTHTWSPAVDIYETAEELVLRVELPGIDPNQVDIQVAGDTLTIRGERRMDGEKKDKRYVRVERSYGAFQRSFTLGLPIDQQGVHASYRDGMLEITLPKREEMKPKQIRVEVQQDRPQEELIEAR